MQLFSPDPYNIFKKILDFAIMTLYLAMSFLCAMTTQFVSLKVTEKLKSKKKKKKKALGLLLGIFLSTFYKNVVYS